MDNVSLGSVARKVSELAIFSSKRQTIVILPNFLQEMFRLWDFAGRSTLATQQRSKPGKIRSSKAFSQGDQCYPAFLTADGKLASTWSFGGKMVGVTVRAGLIHRSAMVGRNRIYRLDGRESQLVRGRNMFGSCLTTPPVPLQAHAVWLSKSSGSCASSFSSPSCIPLFEDFQGTDL